MLLHGLLLPLIISQIYLSIAQPSSSFKHHDTHTFMYVHVRPYNLSALSCYLSTAAFNECYSEIIPYTALANSYGVSIYDVHQFQSHAH